MQEIFVEVWRSAGRFDPERGAESTFITTIAKRRLIDRRRKSGRRIAAASLPDEPLVAAAEEGDGLETREEAERARQLMQQLRPDERRVLELALVEDMSQSDIAAATGLPLGTVKTHARRGLARLRELVQRTPVDCTSG